MSFSFSAWKDRKRHAERCINGPADATAIPKPHHLLPHLNPDWFYLSDTGSSRLSGEKRPLNGCSISSSCSAIVCFVSACIYHTWRLLASGRACSTSLVILLLTDDLLFARCLHLTTTPSTAVLQKTRATTQTPAKAIFCVFKNV